MLLQSLSCPGYSTSAQPSYPHIQFCIDGDMEGGPVQVFPGQRRNSYILHCGDGYYCNVRQVLPTRVRLQCRHYQSRGSGCPGTATVSLEDGHLRHLQPHLHDSDPLLLEDLELRRAMVHEAKTNTFGKKISIILSEAKLRARSVALAMRFTSVRMKSTLYAARSSNYPKIPRTLMHLGVLLSTPNMRAVCQTVDGNDNIYQGIVGCTNQKTVALVFVSGRMLQFLQTRENLFSDGTFKKRSKKPTMAQIFNIVTKYGNNVIAIVRVLMLSRRADAYIAVLIYLRTIAPNMQPRQVHTDFERGEMNAWKTAFPLCRIVGCLWHYGVAFSSKAHNLGLRRLAENNDLIFTYIRCLCGAPLLPQHLIWRGVLEIWAEVETAGLDVAMRPLFEYFEREWLPRLQELSVFAVPDRTNNCAESDNHMLANVLPQNRPNIWHLIGGFVKLEYLAWCDKMAIDAGHPVTGSRKWKTVLNDQRVTSASRLLLSRQITPGHFLHQASHAIHAAVLHGLRLRRNPISSESDSE